VKQLSPYGLTDLYEGSVAVGGDIAIIGAPVDDAINIFYRNQGVVNNWGRVKMIQKGGRFGDTVAISGDTIAVGASETLVGGQRRGAAYIFQRNQGGTDNWGEVKQLIAADGAADDAFGYSVAISGDVVVVGAYYAGNIQQGAAYVFYRNQGGANNWGQVKKIVAADGAAQDVFSNSVSIYGDKIVVGAPAADVNGKANRGAAYVFYRDRGGANNWGQAKKIVAADGAAGDIFGECVSIDEDTMTIGATSADVSGKVNQGAAYVFYRNLGGADNWGQVQKLTASDGASSDQFGITPQVNGSTLVVGAYADAAYVFYRDRGGANN
jgi:spore coat protein U-like protein